mmetsp:Transcript_38060/g.69576  ORF Transcript_38060/g.69576 Transcript_38060/m.69576 type:complete len:171 (+) Transcript_38060:69-581(+)
MRSLLTAVLVLPACAFVVPKFYSQQLRSTLITTQAVDAELVPTAPELVPTAPTKVEPAPDASAEEKADFIASLAEDDEWNGLTMELTGLIGKAVEEDMKRVTRGFIGKEEYKMGDISKEVDKRIKAEVRRPRQVHFIKYPPLIKTAELDFCVFRRCAPCLLLPAFAVRWR